LKAHCNCIRNLYYSAVKTFRTLVFFVACLQTSFSQNLVPDSSFEHNNVMPLEYSMLGANTSWSSPSRGTPDLFCKCGKKQAKISRVNVPKNAMGEQEANTGKCYAGVFAVSHGYYREYMQTSLNSSLQSGKEYQLTMYVSLSDYSPLAIDKIGICFLKENVKYEHSKAITDLKPVYVNVDYEVGVDVNEWHEVTLLYKAKGGENTLLIGAFGIKRLYKTGNTVPPGLSSPIWKKHERDAYYYFDDISIREFIPEKIDTIEPPDNPYFANMKFDPPDTVIVAPDTISRPSMDEVMVLKNVLFETGKSVLSPSSYPELNTIAMYVKADPSIRVEIYGHTDNQGDEQKNKELSLDRAKAVAAFLMVKGVITSNVKYEGMGSSKPIESNETEEGRKRNRRVEFILKK
jgi:OmpA-OmpF porin, OOP family